MNRVYVLALVTHALVAILGVGSIASIAVVTTTARRLGRGPADVSTWLAPLLRISGISLGIMFLTGAFLDIVVGGAFSARWWFRLSAILLVATGVLLARVRRTIRADLATSSGDAAALARVERIAYTMCGLIAAITVLMEAKPF